MDDDDAGSLALVATALVLTVLVGMAILVRGAASATADGPEGLLPDFLVGGAGSMVCGMSGATSQERGQVLDGLDDEQIGHARVIILTGQELGVPRRGQVIAVATAIQESRLRNVAHGDNAGPDSRGLFQQRAPWGLLRERMSPAAAARMFYLGGRGGQPGLQDIPYLQERMSLTEAAQAVQRSRYPDAYGKHEEVATGLVLTFTNGRNGGGDVGMGAPESGLSASGCEAGPAPEVVEQAIAYAQHQLGQPYLWGGDGPDSGEGGFDCSGLTRAAYQAAGVSLPRTAQQQFEHGPKVPLGQLRPGDLVFFGSSTDRVTHVGLYVGDNRMIDAPHSGAVVRVEDHRWSTLLGATRPTAAQ